MKKIILLFACFLPVLAFNSHAQHIRHAEESIRQLLKSAPAMGFSVAVVKNNKLVYSKSFGLKNAETHTPLRTGGIFRIASISKSFSATAIMQLAEKKLLSLDDDVSKLIGFNIQNPKFPKTVITLRMILSHTSSLNDSQGYFSLDVINPEKNKTHQRCYNDYEPGQGYQYCNLNFNIAGTIIERVSGERFDRYIKNHILQPLGLYGGYNVDDLDSARFVTLYEYDSSKFIPSPGAYASLRERMKNYVMGYSTPMFSPTGGMKISAPDLAKYMMMHMNYGRYGQTRIISEKSARTMQTPLSSEDNYGLALWKTDKLISGELLTGHTGSAYGLYSAMFFEPKKKFGIVAITNGCPPAETDGYINTLTTLVNILYDAWIKKR